MTGDYTEILQANIDAASNAGGGRVLVPSGRHVVTRPIVLRKGVVIEGVYPGVSFTGAGTPCSIIEAGADMEAIVTTDPGATDNAMAIRSVAFFGNKAKFDVETGLRLRGRSIRLDQVEVNECSGIGVYWQRASEDTSQGPPWVNWMIGCHIARNGSLAALVECTDSFFQANYFGGGVVQRGGGSSWIGNHFDQATNGKAGLRINPQLGQRMVSGQVCGNYFDLNDIGLCVHPGGGPEPIRTGLIISGNSFRANVIDIEITGMTEPNICGSAHSGAPRTKKGIVFRRCTGGSKVGVTFDESEYRSGFWLNE